MLRAMDIESLSHSLSMTYSLSFNFAVPIKIILQLPTQIKVGTLCAKDHQVLRLDHRLGLVEI